MKVLCSSFDVIVSLQELLMCFWQKVVQILYFHILLSYGGVPDLSLASWAMAHKVSSAKNAQQREQKPHREHTGGIFQRTFLMPFSLTCAPDLHSSGDPITVLLTEHSVKNALLPRQKRNLPSGPWRNSMCEGRACRYNISKCLPSQPEYLLLSEVRFSVEKSQLCSSEWHTFSYTLD